MTKAEVQKAAAILRVKESIDALHRALGQSRSDARAAKDEELHELLNSDPDLYRALGTLDRVVAKLARIASAG